MKHFVKLENLKWILILVVSLGIITSCTKDEAEPLAPVASFQYVVNDTNGLQVTFTNYSRNASTYSWDFGDNIGTSTEESPTYTYADGGNYNATLTASSEVGSKAHTKEITAINPSATNFILNGGFDDESIWSIFQHNTSGNGVLTIADGVATYDELIDVPSGSWGEEAHVGLNQAVTLEAGLYQMDMDITTNGIDECWFEVWVGLEAPVEFAEYNQDNSATKVLSFNAWDCGETNKVYSGPMAVASCQDTDGSISLDAGTYYIVIRSGGFTFGEGGIVIDNVSMVKVD